MGAHLIDGEFQSDKYPTTPRGKVPLSVKDPTAQDLLWEYAQRRRAVDAEFSDDLETALRAAGFAPAVQTPTDEQIVRALNEPVSDVEVTRLRILFAHPPATPIHRFTMSGPLCGTRGQGAAMSTTVALLTCPACRRMSCEPEAAPAPRHQCGYYGETLARCAFHAGGGAQHITCRAEAPEAPKVVHAATKAHETLCGWVAGIYSLTAIATEVTCSACRQAMLLNDPAAPSAPIPEPAREPAVTQYPRAVPIPYTAAERAAMDEATADAREPKRGPDPDRACRCERYIVKWNGLVEWVGKPGAAYWTGKGNKAPIDETWRPQQRYAKRFGSAAEAADALPRNLAPGMSVKIVRLVRRPPVAEPSREQWGMWMHEAQRPHAPDGAWARCNEETKEWFREEGALLRGFLAEFFKEPQ